MCKEHASGILDTFSRDCALCRMCVSDCTLLGDLEMQPAEIAQAIARQQVDDKLLAAIQRCDLCGKCGRSCPAGLNPGDLFLAARENLVQAGRISAFDYDVMLVNRDWNFFTIYRATNGIRFDDLASDRGDSLFFPGCSLASYAPDLARAALRWLRERGLRVGFTDRCCGKPLASSGLLQKANRYVDGLCEHLAAAGIRRIITACPNCLAQLRAARMPKVEIRSIYDLMVEAGVHLSGGETLAFHDACPDRYDSENPARVRELMSGFAQVEMTSHGPDTICCGSGGIVSTIDPDLAATRARRRLAEFSASGADVCVTNCMACAYRLSRAGVQVRHCLEYAFDLRMDYDRVALNAQRMWQGSQGEENRRRLTEARPMSFDGIEISGNGQA